MLSFRIKYKWTFIMKVAIFSALVAVAEAKIQPGDWQKYPDTGCAPPHKCTVRLPP